MLPGVGFSSQLKSSGEEKKMEHNGKKGGGVKSGLIFLKILYTIDRTSNVYKSDGNFSQYPMMWY